jgi:hypothetical protein
MYNAESHPKVFCQNGHEFEDIGEAMAYEAMSGAAQAPAQDTAPSPAPAKPALQPVAMEPPPEKVPDHILASMPHEARPPEPTERLVPKKDVAPVPVMAAVRGIELEEDKLRTIAATMQAEDTESSKTRPRRNGKFVPPPARSAPGGILIMTVRIPDEHVSPLRAESEVQGQTVEQFLQERLEYALQSRWIY